MADGESVPKLTNADQIWILEQVKSGLMTPEEALEEARKKQESHGIPIPNRSTKVKQPSLPPRSPTAKKTKTPTTPTVGFETFLESPAEMNISSPIIPWEVQQNPLSVQDRKMSVKSAASHSSEEEGWLTRQDSLTPKSGDGERVMIFEHVKSGRMTIDDAVKYANDLGLVSSASQEADTIAEASSAVADQKVYNFAVYKTKKHGKGLYQTQVRRILQIDFGQKVISMIERGNVFKKYGFAQVLDFDSKEDDVALKIFINDDGTGTELDMDADNPDEKNKIIRLLSVIINLNKADVRLERDYTEALPKLQMIIKEGQLEKKGRGFNPWVKRWVRVRHGEVSYYRPHEETALNIIQLVEGMTAVTKVDNNGFIIVKDVKQYPFRVATDDRTPAQVKKERDHWVQVILEASHGEKKKAAAEEEVPPQLSVEGPAVEVKFNLNQLRQELANMKQQLQTLQIPEAVIGQADKIIQMATMLETQPGTEKPQSETTTSNIPAEFPTSETDDKKLYAEIKRRTMYLSRVSRPQPDVGPQGRAENLKSAQELDDIGENGCVDEDPGYETVFAEPLLKPEENTSGSQAEHQDALPVILEADIPLAPPEYPEPDLDILKPAPPPRKTPEKPKHDVPSEAVQDESKTSEASEQATSLSTDTEAHNETETSEAGVESSFGGSSEPTVESSTPGPGPSPPPPPPVTPPVNPAVPPPPAPPSAPGFFSSLMSPSRKALKKTSKTKLKAFHWNKVPKNLYNKSTMWKSAEDVTDKIDTAILEEFFNTSQDVPPTPTVATAQKQMPKSLLEPRKAQNLSIVLTGLKMSVEQLQTKLNIIKENEGALPLDQVCMLRRLQPTSDDIEMYKNYKGRRESLQPTDQFMMQLCDIPNLNVRLDALVAIMELPVQFEELEPTVVNMNKACGELLASSKFPRVLEFILATGNILNYSSKKDVADGFQMSSLTKLADMRGRDRKYNLLQFVIEQIGKRQEDLLKFYDELGHVEACCDMSIKGLNAEIAVMKQQVSKVDRNAKLLKKAKASALDNKFQQDVQDFVTEYEKKLKTFNDHCMKTLTMYKKTLEFFGESPERDSEEFFSCLCEFIKSFKKAVIEYEKAKNTNNPGKALAETLMQGIQKPSFDVSKLGGAKSFDMGMLNSANMAKSSSKEYPTKEGNLEKLSGGKHRAAKWDKRYFEISTSGHLHYYKKKFDKILGSVYLRRVPVKIEEDDPTVIFIDTEERDFKIKAKTVEEAQEWFTVLCFYGIKQ